MKTGDRGFWDDYAPRYEAFLQHVRGQYECLIELIGSRCDKQMDVLEVGTGTGAIARRLAERVGHVAAIDPSPAMIREAESNRSAAGITNLEFAVRDGYATGFAPGAFDLVVISNVLHVIEEPASLLEEARRVTRPQGLVLIASYCHGTSWLTRLVSAIMELRGFRACHKWSPESLERYVRSCGFAVQERAVISGLIPIAVLSLRA